MAIGIYDTADLVQVIRTVQAPSNYWLSLAFPSVITFQSAEIDFDLVDTGRRLAPFVAPTSQGKPMMHKGFATRKFRPAYVKPKDPVDPNRLIKRRPGEALTGELTLQQREDLIVADIVETHRSGIERRWEWMAARAIIDGAVEVSGPDYPTVQVSFGRDAAFTKTLLTTDRWSDPASKPLVQIESWMQEMHRKSGYTPTRITMGINAWNDFIGHADVKELFETRRGSTTSGEMGPGKGLPWQYRMSLSNGLEIWTYNDIYEDDLANQVNFLDQDTIVLTSPAIDGVRAFGAILDHAAGYVATDIFGKMWVENDPSELMMMHQSAPLMIPTRPNASMKIKVR